MEQKKYESHVVDIKSITSHYLVLQFYYYYINYSGLCKSSFLLGKMHVWVRLQIFKDMLAKL